MVANIKSKKRLGGTQYFKSACREGFCQFPSKCLRFSVP